MNFFKRNIYNHPVISLAKRGQFVFYMSFLEKLIYFIIFIFLARKFSISQYGFIISIFAFGNILVTMFELGFGNYFQRKIASDRSNLSEEVNSVLVFRLASYFIIIFLAVLYFPKNFVNLALVVTIISTIFLFSTNWILIKIFYGFDGLDNYRSVFYRFLISRIVLITGVIILLPLDMSVTVFMTLFLITAILEFSLLFYSLTGIKIILFRFELNAKFLRKILTYSIPMGMSVFFVIVYDKIDIILIQNIISTEAVSFYAIAYSIYKIPSIVIPILLTPLFTDLSNEFELYKKINLLKLRSISFLLLAFAGFSIIIIYIFADRIIVLTYGIKYLSSTSLLTLLSLALPFLFLNNLTGTTLNSIKKERFAFYSTMIGAVANILINLILLNTIGLMGAVITTIVSELLVLLLQSIYLLKFRVGVAK